MSAKPTRLSDDVLWEEVARDAVRPLSLRICPHQPRNRCYLFLQVNDLKAAVERNPDVGIKVVMALLGNTGGNFDRISNTKIVEGILGKADANGVKSYVDYLIDTAYSAEDEAKT